MAFRDYKVRYLSRERVALVAFSWWLIADRVGNAFNICDFVTQVLTKRLKDKGTLQIELYDSDEDLPEGACVTFKPLTLHILKRIWADAKAGRPYARFIVAHEIGHMVLHNIEAIAFSNDKGAVLNFVEKEESAEEQANAFADLFLVPDHIALRLRDVDTIAGLCVVSDDMAKRRLQDALMVRKPLQPEYTGDSCERCTNFTVLRVGIRTKCDTCGTLYSEQGGETVAAI